MNKKIPLFTILFYTFLLSLLGSFIFIYYFNKVLSPQLITYAEKEVKYITNLVINNSIRNYHYQGNTNNYLIIEKNNQNEITLITYNTELINNTTTKITETLEKDLKYLTNSNFKELNLKIDTIPNYYYDKINDGIILTIPIGMATNNKLLSNIGPKIPIKLKLVGEISTNIKSKVKEYGLNNALIELYIETKSTISIQMPFISKEITIKNNIPLTMQIIQGNIPEYYLGKTN